MAVPGLLLVFLLVRISFWWRWCLFSSRKWSSLSSSCSLLLSLSLSSSCSISLSQVKARLVPSHSPPLLSPESQDKSFHRNEVSCLFFIGRFFNETKPWDFFNVEIQLSRIFIVRTIFWALGMSWCWIVQRLFVQYNSCDDWGICVLLDIERSTSPPLIILQSFACFCFVLSGHLLLPSSDCG